jgi:DNA-binding CsgD family transcriptional regulator
MEFGFSCADHGPDGSQLLLCFCGSTPIAPAPEDWDKTTSASVMLASLTHRTLIRLARRGAAAGEAEKPRLTVAEFQALQLTASAMTAKQVATKLGVKPETVRYYLSRAAEKLGADSRREAVTMALEKGLIDTRTFSTVGFSDKGVF